MAASSGGNGGEFPVCAPDFAPPGTCFPRFPGPFAVCSSPSPPIRMFCLVKTGLSGSGSATLMAGISQNFQTLRAVGTSPSAAEPPSGNFSYNCAASDITMDALLRNAYLATTYRCRAPRGGIDIRIGQSHVRLDSLLREHASRSWCFITACNPQSKRLGSVENRLRNSELRQEIDSRGWIVFEGEGIGDSGDWPAEPSFLVLGIGRREAIGLARRFDQAAIVAGEAGKPAELILCNPPSPD